MNRNNHSYVLWLIFLSLVFSCKNKSGFAPAEHADSLQTDSAKIIADSAATHSDKKKSEAASWVVNQQSKVNFTITNFGKEVHGTLAPPKGIIRFDEKNPGTSYFEVTVPIASIKTGNNMRDNDLMHPKYFDQEHHPDITFRSDEIVKSGNGFVTKGTLTIKGKSLHKEIPFTFEQNDNTGTFKSQFTIARLDYDIGGTGPIMGKEINISLEIVTEKK